MRIVIALAAYALLSLGAVFSNPHTGHCQERSDAELARAIEERLTIGVRVDGTRVHIRHCRRAPGGCEARSRRLAELFVGAGARHGVDPFLLAAIALKESGLDSRAVGAAGELGLMQLHPRSPWGRRARARCAAAAAECDAIVVDEAAALLARALADCGELGEALGMYNSGGCGANRYAERVLRIHVAMNAARQRATLVEGSP